MSGTWEEAKVKVLSRLTRSATSTALVSFLTLATVAGPLSAAASGTPEHVSGYTTERSNSSIKSIAAGLQNSPPSAPSSLLAGEPEADVIMGSVAISTFIYARDAAGASAARNFVHSSQSCAWNFCTIQNSAGGTRYKVFMFDPTIGQTSYVKLYNFEGLWDTHNHSGDNGGSGFTVRFLDANLGTIGTYGPRRSDNVQWTPIYNLSFPY
jgi:hypothetical protein